MKNSILIILMTLCISTIVSAQISDKELVEKTVNYYLEGGTNNDFDMLQKAFHKTATMKYIKNGDYQEVNAIEFFRKAIKPGPKQKRTTRIAEVSVTGNVASAKLEIDYATFGFTDYMHLIKTDGEWKVVSKIFYRKSK